MSDFRFKKNLFNRILVDAPCSCSGLLRKHPELKYKITMNKILAMKKLQTGILSIVSGSLKNGGIIVYSTCSLEKEENEFVVEEFLNEYKNFTICEIDIFKEILGHNSSGIYRIFPDDFGSDGFSFAVLRKESD